MVKREMQKSKGANILGHREWMNENYGFDFCVSCLNNLKY
jgi:hypothetical protein